MNIEIYTSKAALRTFAFTKGRQPVGEWLHVGRYEPGEHRAGFPTRAEIEQELEGSDVYYHDGVVTVTRMTLPPA